MGFLRRLVDKAKIKSPWVFHFNSGGCNGCDIEIIAALMPRLDLERFGVKLVGSPRHADIMLCTGPVTEQIKPRLQRIYEQMAEPKYVVAVGSCACSGGVFRGAYNVLGGVDQAIPVTAYVPGCPPKPSAIMYGAYQLLQVLAEIMGVSPKELAPEFGEPPAPTVDATETGAEVAQT
ncbi:MAG: NADH-quinone oxidoreductase subunit B family protein [Candidatus Thorarchaeota archaeon]